MVDKKEDSLGISFYIFVAMISILVFFIFFNLRRDGIEKVECLEKIAERICEQEGYIYFSSSSHYKSFDCMDNNRQKQEFLFTKEELESCSK